MKKIAFVFCLAWSVYCLINAGFVVTQPKWREIINSDPNVVQDNAGDIFNRSARILKSRGLTPNEDVTLYSDVGTLRSLSLVYWLYPTHFVSSTQPSLAATFANPGHRYFYYVGSTQAYKKNLVYLNKSYQPTVVYKDTSQIMVVMKKT